MIKEASIFDSIRNRLIRFHPFFYGLFSCYFCVGFHAGWIVYLLSFDYFNWRTMILWGLAGAATSFLINLIVDKLLNEPSGDRE
jgi:ABC-type Fe3+-siderophore transport system permease subunit